MAMQEMFIVHGDNDYELQHLNKAQLERTGALPMSIETNADALETILMSYPASE